jgi:phosphoglycerate dehydrogenase-like enzyme
MAMPFIRALACGLMLASGCSMSSRPQPVMTEAMLDQPLESPPVDAESFGSTRNSRVAIPVKGRHEPLIMLAGDIAQEELNELAKIAPNVKIISGLNRQTALQYAAQAHAIDVSVLSPELLQRAPNLVWVQAFSAGIERYLTIKPLVENDRILLTNMRAVHGPAIADHAMAMLLQLTRNLRHYANHQQAREWNDGDTPWLSSALAGKTMLVVGLGGIGAEIAQRAHGFGMTVIATRRSEAPKPDLVRRVGNANDLLTMLPQADVIAICVPLTAETRGMFNQEAFAACNRGAMLINIARGKIINTDALVAALKERRLAGACLDVTDPEPLPHDHELWSMPNVIITPHVAADAEITTDRRRALVRENIRRFGAGEPLLNVVDKKAGY